jgi:hypothetical protein
MMKSVRISFIQKHCNKPLKMMGGYFATERYIVVNIFT